MKGLPHFLRGANAGIGPGGIDDSADPHRPLVAAWLIEMALLPDW